jgi:hypothetical protein
MRSRARTGYRVAGLNARLRKRILYQSGIDKPRRRAAVRELIELDGGSRPAAGKPVGRSGLKTKLSECLLELRYALPRVARTDERGLAVSARSSTASVVMDEVITIPLPTSILTWAVVWTFLISTIFPLSWFLALIFFIGSTSPSQPCPE